MYALPIVILLIVCGSLYPWHFAAAHTNPWLILIRSWPGEWNVSMMSDAFLNVVVYVPLGALAFLSQARRRSPRAAVAVAILTGLFLSLGMELLQVYVPGRTSSLLDVANNVTGAFVGALAAWRFQMLANRSGRPALPPVLLLGCWACYHLYPFVPSILFSRMRFELMLWLHPQSVSFIEIWGYASEWVAVGIAVRQLFGRIGLRWLPVALAFHFAVRPFIPARPLVLEEALGIILGVLLWKGLPEQLGSSPALLISAVLLREFAPLHWSVVPPVFSWIPFQAPLTSRGGRDILLLSRATFDYAGILWLWQNRGMSYEKAGAILVSALAVLAVIQRYLPGDALSMTDPALAFLLALTFRTSSTAQDKPAAFSWEPLPAGGFPRE